MGLNRELKLFWADHRDPILFWSMVIAGVIFITQTLNAMVKAGKEQDNSNQIINETIITITQEENQENKELIEKFINFCKQEKTAEAYDLLSEECKTELYQDLNSFESKYYNKIFNQKREIQIEIIDNETYKIEFKEDILQSGKVEGRDSIIDYYKIVQAIGENKLYINANNIIK